MTAHIQVRFGIAREYGSVQLRHLHILHHQGPAFRQPRDILDPHARRIKFLGLKLRIMRLPLAIMLIQMLNIEFTKEMLWTTDSNSLRKLAIVLVAEAKRDVFIAAKGEELVAVHVDEWDAHFLIVIVGLRPCAIIVAAVRS